MSKPQHKKDNALEIGKLIDKTVQVKLTGGREGERLGSCGVMVWRGLGLGWC